MLRNSIRQAVVVFCIVVAVRGGSAFSVDLAEPKNRLVQIPVSGEAVFLPQLPAELQVLSIATVGGGTACVLYTDDHDLIVLNCVRKEPFGAEQYRIRTTESDEEIDDGEDAEDDSFVDVPSAYGVGRAVFNAARKLSKSKRNQLPAVAKIYDRAAKTVDVKCHNLTDPAQIQREIESIQDSVFAAREKYFKDSAFTKAINDAFNKAYDTGAADNVKSIAGALRECAAALRMVK